MQKNKNIMKLHLGCGKRYIPGFVHIDLVDYSHIDYICNVADLSIFEDNSIELIYACHILEHFKKYDIENVLKEWYRVLISNGVLRLAVPDFEAIVEYYKKTKDLKILYSHIYGGQKNDLDYHYCAFDFKLLSEMLTNIGFRKIQIYDWREIVHYYIDDYSQAYLPHMDKVNGKLMSLNVEAIK